MCWVIDMYFCVVRTVQKRKIIQNNKKTGDDGWLGLSHRECERLKNTEGRRESIYSTHCFQLYLATVTPSRPYVIRHHFCFSRSLQNTLHESNYCVPLCVVCVLCGQVFS